jgi:hypothetical protein
LLRDIFGNLFRLVVFSPSWRTDTAVSLALQMYAARDFSALPILADALQDAGRADEQVLTHCRGEASPVRGCWVIDLILGKTRAAATGWEGTARLGGGQGRGSRTARTGNEPHPASLPRTGVPHPNCRRSI